jgi:hypothetical protein
VLAVKEAHADGEYLVEAAVFRVETFEVTGDELGLAGFEVRCVASRGGLDHLRRAVYGGEMSSFEALANERRRDPVSAPDLEYPVIGTYIELLDDLSQPLAHDRPVFGEIFWLSEKRFSGS